MTSAGAWSSIGSTSVAVASLSLLRRRRCVSPPLSSPSSLVADARPCSVTPAIALRPSRGSRGRASRLPAELPLRPARRSASPRAVIIAVMFSSPNSIPECYRFAENLPNPFRCVPRVFARAKICIVKGFRIFPPKRRHFYPQMAAKV